MKWGHGSPVDLLADGLRLVVLGLGALVFWAGVFIYAGVVWALDWLKR